MQSSSPFKNPNNRIQDDEKEFSSRQLYGNMVLCLAIIFFSIFGFQWILSDISGVYSVNDPNLRSPVTLSLVRKPTRLEGELSLARGQFLTLTHSESKDDQIHLTFQSTQNELDVLPLTVNVDGVYEDGKIKATFTSGGKTVKLELVRDSAASIHKIMQAHMP